MTEKTDAPRIEPFVVNQNFYFADDEEYLERLHLYAERQMDEKLAFELIRRLARGVPIAVTVHPRLEGPPRRDNYTRFDEIEFRQKVDLALLSWEDAEVGDVVTASAIGTVRDVRRDISLPILPPLRVEDPTTTPSPTAPVEIEYRRFRRDSAGWRRIE